MNDDIIHMPIPRSMFTAVCALLGGASISAVAVSAKASPASPVAEPAPNAAAAAEPAAAGDTAGDASVDGVLDAGGWPWSAEMHASTKGLTKEGYWRMKVGVSRPDPKPGFPKADPAAQTGGTGTASDGAASTPAATAASPAAGQADDEDEFAMFRAAADKASATDAAAAASVPARKFTDADLGALCNQAAVKLGDPAPIKELIGQYVPAGAVPHSRNIPDDQRAAFVAAVEAKAGITFAG